MRRSSRRSSILKPPRGSLRAPELDGLSLGDDEGFTQPSSRRVSFSRISQVQEFDPTIGKLANWKYEETVNIEEDKDYNARYVSVHEENTQLPSTAQRKSRRRSGKFSQRDDYGSDLPDFCKDLDVTTTMDNSMMSMNKTSDLCDSSMFDWDVKSMSSKIDMHLSVVEDKKRMYADIESPTKVDTKRMKVKSTSQVQFDRTVGSEMDMTLTLGGIEDDGFKPDNSGCGMEMTEVVGKILTAKVNEGQKDVGLDWSPQESTQNDENESILSKLNCLGINTPLGTPKDQNYSTISMKNGDVKKPVNENLISGIDEMEFTKALGKFEVQGMPAKVFQENSMQKENIHPEILMKKGQKMNRDLIFGESSMRENSIQHSKGDGIWEGRHKTSKNSGKIDFSVRDESVAFSDGMELTVPLGQLLPTKLDKTREGETSQANTSRNPSFPSSSRVHNGSNVLEEQNSMYLIPKGRKSMSVHEFNDRGNGRSVQDEDFSHIQNKYRENPETDMNISGLEFTVPLGKLIHHNKHEADEHINAYDKENYPVKQSSHRNEMTHSDSRYQNSVQTSKHFGCSENVEVNDLNNSGQLDESLPENDGMELTVPLGKLMELKPSRVDRSVMQLKEKKQDMDGMDFTLPQERLIQQKQFQMNESAKQVEATRHDMDGMDLTLPQERLIQQRQFQMNESAKQVEVSRQDMNGLDFILPQERLTLQKQFQMNESAKQVEATRHDMDGMDLTLPQERLIQQRQFQMNESVKQFEATRHDMDGMDLTLPQERLIQQRQFQMNESVKQFEATRQEMDGMDLTLPQERLIQQRQFQMNESAKKFEVSRHDMDGMDLTLPQERLIQQNQFQMDESGNELDATQQEMEFTVPLGKLMQLKQNQVNENGKKLEKSREQADVMDSAVPQGGLMSLKPSNVSEVFEEPDVSSQQIEGMELTVPLGKLLDIKSTNLQENIPVIPSKMVDGMEPSILCRKSMPYEPEVASTRDIIGKETEESNVTLTRGSSFRKSSNSFLKSNVSRKGEDSMYNVSAQVIGKESNDQMFSFRNETLGGVQDVDTKDISYKIGEPLDSMSNNFSRNGAQGDTSPYEDRMENPSRVTVNLQINPVVEPFMPGSKLQVIVENSAGSDVYGNSSNIQMEVSFKNSSSQNPVNSELIKSDNVIKSSNANITLDIKSSAVKEKEEIGKTDLLCEAPRLSEVDKRCMDMEYLSNSQLKMENTSEYGNSIVFEKPGDKSRGSKRENPFQYSSRNFKRGAIGNLSSIVSVSEDESVSTSEGAHNIVDDIHVGISSPIEVLNEQQVYTQNNGEEEAKSPIKNESMPVSLPEKEITLLPTSKKDAIEGDEMELTENHQNLEEVKDISLVHEESLSQKQISCQVNKDETFERRESQSRRELSPVPLSKEVMEVHPTENQHLMEASENSYKQTNENEGNVCEDEGNLKQVSCQNSAEEKVERQENEIESSPALLPEKEMVILPEVNEENFECIKISSEPSNEKQMKIDNIPANHSLCVDVGQQLVCSKNDDNDGVERRTSLVESGLSPIPKDDSANFLPINEEPIDIGEKISDQSLLSSTLITKEFDLEEWMKKETSRKWCPWSIRKLEDSEWSFYFFYGTVKLTLKLKPNTLPSDTKSRSVDQMELISLLDVGNRDCDYLIVNMFLERCSPEILRSMCQTTDQLPELFAFMCQEINKLDSLHRQTTKLSKYYPVIFKDNGFVFSFGSKILMKLFYVKVNLFHWKDGCIEANDVKVINKLGTMREKDIQDILKSVKKDNNYLPKFYDEVKSFVKMLEDLED